MAPGTSDFSCSSDGEGISTARSTSFRKRGVVESVAEPQRERAGLLRQQLPDGGCFVVAAQDVMEAGAASAGVTGVRDGLFESKGTGGVEDDKRLVEFAGGGKACLVLRQAAPDSNFLDSHIAESADGAGRRGGGIAEHGAQFDDGRTKDDAAAVNEESTTVFNDVGAVDVETLPPPLGLGTRLAGAKHERDVLVAQAPQRGPRGFERV